ncbi:MAG: transmembrane anchor protein [Pseudomonas sp.]|nr:transmembrane anchor protein [Pseudomonas sp.]
MFNRHRPSLDELPSSAQLLRSTLLALGIASTLLVTVVLPAEFALDPSGAGRLLGMTQMGELKATLAREAATEPAQPAPAPGPVAAPAAPTTAAQTPASAEQQHEVNLVLQPNEGTEIKLEMKQGAKVTYHWTANGDRVNYDTHGDPYNAPRDFYHGYGKGKQAPEQQGELVAAFDGRHGWYWRNRSDQPVKLTLRTRGDYITIEQMF